MKKHQFQNQGGGVSPAIETMLLRAHTVITLRPTLIATTVRNMCFTATILRLTGLDAVEVADMYGFPELRAILPKLKIGEAMIMGIGAPLDRPVPVQIRKRYSKHGGVGVSLEETLLTKEELKAS